jgi:hypothetical protein
MMDARFTGVYKLDLYLASIYCSTPRQYFSTGEHHHLVQPSKHNDSRKKHTKKTFPFHVRPSAKQLLFCSKVQASKARSSLKRSFAAAAEDECGALEE